MKHRHRNYPVRLTCSTSVNESLMVSPEVTGVGVIDSCEQADITCQRRPIHYHANIILTCLSSVYTQRDIIWPRSYMS